MIFLSRLTSFKNSIIDEVVVFPDTLSTDKRKTSYQIMKSVHGEALYTIDQQRFCCRTLLHMIGTFKCVEWYINRQNETQLLKFDLSITDLRQLW